ncbi:hypothetical protein AII18_14420 [Salmonella enterica]|nr:hypothetical protein [Salmonella enterica]EAZ0469821.1 hypothetical protein [Salmonella enterica]
MRRPTQKSGFTAAFFLCMANQMCQMMVKDNETAKFIFSAAVRFSKLMPSVVSLSVIFDQLIVS